MPIAIPPEHRAEYNRLVREKEQADRLEARLFNNTTGKPRKGYEQAVRKANAAHVALARMVDRIRRHGQSEPERAPRRLPREADTRPRNLDVPLEFLQREAGPFKPGYDSKYKSELIKSALGEGGRWSRQDAIDRLSARGWLNHLDKAEAVRTRRNLNRVIREATS